MAHIARNRRYIKEFRSSFYGFANDRKGHRYTIGVLVIQAGVPQKYFASRSVAPIFGKVVDVMVKKGMLSVSWREKAFAHNEK